MLNVLESSDLEKILANALKKEMAKLLEVAKESHKKEVYTNKEMLELLDVHPKTLKKYRDNGWIGFTQYDDKFYYSSADLQHFLNYRHEIPFAYK
jgi:hypothetical protein